MLKLLKLNNRKNEMDILSPEEKEYIESAIKAGVQSTEMLNVLVITRAVMEMKNELVGAMEKPDHKVMPTYPRDIQTVYTMMKVEINNIYKRVSLGIIGD